MNGLSFLTPLSALVVVAVVLPLGAYVAFERRADRVRQILGLSSPRSRARTIILGSLTLAAAALGIAAAQPVLTHSTIRGSRMDAEAFAVFDITRSMGARSRGGATRLERAKSLALHLRRGLPDIPFGVASFSTSALPHLFPNPDETVFDATVRDAVRIGSPPSQNVTSATQRTTDLASIGALARGYFDPSAKHRLVIVFTDGESYQFFPQDVADAYRRPPVQTILVHVWGAHERIYLSGNRVDPGYRPDPAGQDELERLAAATGGAVYSEHSFGAILARARADLGKGPTRRESAEPGRTPLAPWVLGFAFLPVAVILRRRNL